ncbi:MAG: restriction endonuclease subunit S [Xanthomonadaceae bacterium]|nr:restriction endonuclease subunit S [Xanthomonadaceae bacterium]
MEIDLCAIAPADWEIKSVVDVCQRITSGGTPSRREPAYYDGGVWPWVKTQELQDCWIDDTEEHITEKAIAASSAKALPANTILLAMYGATVGQLGILRRSMTCNQACCALIADPDKADFRFLYFQLLQIRSELKSLATGAAQQNLSGAIVKSLRLPFPPIEEQRAIAHILGTLDDKIELNRKQNETLEAVARALFKAWFVDFEPVRAKLEGRWQRGQSLPGLPAHLYDLFPDRLVESELGEIPEGWRVEELSEHLDVLETGRRPKGGVGGINEGVPSVGAESIIGIGHFDFGKTKYVSEQFFATMKSGHAENMDVMLYKDGGKPGDFRPRVSMFGRGFPFERYAINEHVFRMRSESLGQVFLYLQISHERVLFDLRNRGGKAAIPGINQSDVKTLLLVVPPREVLAAFDQAALPMMEGVLERAVGGRSLVQLRDTLLPKLISGELRVTDAERMLQGLS